MTTTDESTFWRVLAVVRQVFAIVLIALPAGTLIWLLLSEPRPGALAQAPLLLLMLPAVYGLALRRIWARWLGLALGLAGAVFGLTDGGLSLLILLPPSALLLLCLLGGGMARRYELQPSPRSPWPDAGWRTHVLNWAMVLGLASVPALSLAVAPGASRTTINIGAGVAALLLITAPILATRQRTAGLIALLLGAAAAAGAAVEGFSGLTDYFNACSGHRADDIATFFAVSCVPAMLGGALVTVASASPVRRFLRR